jgi:hypothetical protein
MVAPLLTLDASRVMSGDFMLESLSMLRFMSRNIMQIILCLSVVLLPATVLAALSPDVADDFTPVRAALVMPQGSEWIIDQDASAGVRSGDLFSVVMKGKPIVHPQTREIIGTVEDIKGVLQVTKVKSGYSYAKVLQADGELAPGQQLKRYYNLPGSFWDYTGDGEALFVELRDALPHLEWQSFAEAQKSRPQSPVAQPGLTRVLFILTEQGLAVKDNALQPIGFYQTQVLTGRQSGVGEQLASGTGPAAASGIITANRTTNVVPRASSKGVFGKLSDKLFGSDSPMPGVVPAGLRKPGGLIFSSKEKMEGVWYGPRMQGQPVGVEVGDLDGDGQQEVAIAFHDRIVVGRVSDGQFEQLTSHELAGSTKPLSLDGVDLDQDGKVELYLTAVTGLQASSTVFEWQAGKLVASIQNIPWFIRRVALPGEGNVLLGQVIDSTAKENKSDYYGPVFRISRVGKELSKAAELTLPKQIELNGFLLYAGADHPMLLNLNIDNKLQLLEQDGSLMWESQEEYGGSKNLLQREGAIPGDPRYRFLKQRLEAGPENTVLIPVNEGSGMTDLWRKYSKSHLEALTYDGYSLVERWRTKPLSGYLADYRLADIDNDDTNELVMIVQFAQGDWLDSTSGISALVFYEMQ